MRGFLVIVQHCFLESPNGYLVSVCKELIGSASLIQKRLLPDLGEKKLYAEKKTNAILKICFCFFFFFFPTESRGTEDCLDETDRQKHRQTDCFFR